MSQKGGAKKQPKKKHTGKRRFPKLPDGFGSIKALSGSRRRPYAAVTTTRKGAPSGRPHAIGYYSTWYGAFQALCDYNLRLREGKAGGPVFGEVYRDMMEEKFGPGSRLSDSSRRSYASAFKNVGALHGIPLRELRPSDMQRALDACPLGYSSLRSIKRLFRQVYRYAMKNDMVEKDYSEYVAINRENNIQKGVPFSPGELEKLWGQAGKDEDAEMVLLMVYSGYRITAYETLETSLEEGTFRGGVKTPQSRDRVVPIHEAVRGFAGALREKEFKGDRFRRKGFYPLLERLGILYTAEGKKHTPHDCRHTFSWLCDRAGVDSLTKHLLMGHKPGRDVEESVYGHRTLEELREAVGKLEAPSGKLRRGRKAA